MIRRRLPGVVDCAENSVYDAVSDEMTEGPRWCQTRLASLLEP